MYFQSSAQDNLDKECSSVEKLITQGRSAFGNENVVAADDLMTVSIPNR